MVDWAELIGLLSVIWDVGGGNCVLNTASRAGLDSNGSEFGNDSYSYRQRN